MPSAKVSAPIRGHQRGGTVENHHVASWTPLTVQDTEDHRRVGGRVTARDGLARCGWESQRLRVDLELAHTQGGDLVPARHAVEAELVDATRAGEDERVMMAESLEHLRHHRNRRAAGHTEGLVAHPSRVGERAEHVEDSADAQLAPGG